MRLGYTMRFAKQSLQTTILDGLAFEMFQRRVGEDIGGKKAMQRRPGKYTIVASVFASLMLTSLAGCDREVLTPEELEAKREFCSQFSSESECVPDACEWDVKIRCAIPGQNCGVAYTGRKECFYR